MECAGGHEVVAVYGVDGPPGVPRLPPGGYTLGLQYPDLCATPLPTSSLTPCADTMRLQNPDLSATPLPTSCLTPYGNAQLQPVMLQYVGCCDQQIQM